MTLPENPLVSIIITTYNYAAFLPTAIQSALKQSYENIEIIIVNDGSTDNTDEVMKPFLKNQKIKYIKQKNAGQASSKNRGVWEAGGKFIAFLDADDYWMDEKLNEQLPLFYNDEEVGIVYTRATWVDTDGNTIKTNEGLPSTYSGWITDQMIVDNFMPFSSTVIRRECFEKCGVFDEALEMSIDWDLWLRMSIQYKVDYVGKNLIGYRVGHSGQMSKNQEKRRKQSDRVLNNFLANNPGVVSSSVLKKAKLYSYKHRGIYYCKKNIFRSVNYLFRAMLLNPFQPSVYYYLLKNFVPTKVHLFVRNVFRKNQ